MGHKGSIEAKYTTNKGILPKSLIDEMRAAFKRSEEFLDLEKSEEDPLEKQRDEIKQKMESMTHEELALMQELLQRMGNCKTSAGNECLPQMKQNDSSRRDGNTSELYQMEKWSSKNRLRDNSMDGPKGLRSLGSPVMSRLLYQAELWALKKQISFVYKSYRDVQ